MKRAFQQGWKLYLMEALGLGIFMVSACFFTAILESTNSSLHQLISNGFTRLSIIGILMGATALLIFHSPFTAASGTHINPAVTLALLRAGRINKHDAFYYIIFQFIGGTIAVYLMQLIMGSMLTEAPVNSVATIPGKAGTIPALITEMITAFIMMTMVLFTSSDRYLNKYTRIIAGCMVCLFVIIAGPISGFGMNPARTFASALSANTWTGFWIYMFAPIAGMMAATELFLLINSKKQKENTQDRLFNFFKKTKS